MKKIIFTIRESTEGGFEARSLGESIFTEADNVEEIKTRIKEAVDCHFDDNDPDKPEIIHLHFYREEMVAA